MNLRTIPHLAQAFEVVAGLSDHTLGTAVAVAAVSLGAALIEKHVTLRRADGGPDASFSLEPAELRQLVEQCRMAQAALGHVSYAREMSERGNAVFRRSLYAVADIAAGETLGPHNLRSIRPGFGLAPKHLDSLLGKRARRAIARGTPMAWDLVE
jgi:N-acetylneuraminate synthase